MSGLAGRLGVAVGSSVGLAQFEFIFPPPMADDVVVSGVVVSASVWAARLALAPDSKSVHLVLS